MIIAASLDRLQLYIVGYRRNYTEQPYNLILTMVIIRREVYVNSEVTGTTKVIHVPAFGGMLYVDHIITDLLLLIVLVFSWVVGRERMGTTFPLKKLSGNGVPTREILRDIFLLLPLN